MKKRYILMAVTAALVFAVAAGGTLAANQVESIEDVSTPLAAQTLTIGLNGGSADINISAGGKVTAEQADIAFTAENTGDIDSFIRVTINKYWETSSGEYLPADNVEIDYGADSAYWLDAAKVEANPLQDDDTQVFYYMAPLEAGKLAQDALIKSIYIKGEETGNTYADAILYVEAVADGVQYAAGHDDVNEAAILGSWGVKATVENGRLTGVAMPD